MFLNFIFGAVLGTVVGANAGFIIFSLINNGKNKH